MGAVYPMVGERLQKAAHRVMTFRADPGETQIRPLPGMERKSALDGTRVVLMYARDVEKRKPLIDGLTVEGNRSATPDPGRQDFA